MKLKALFGGLFVAVLATASIAEAQTNTPVINARQHNQEKRIRNGVRSGALTHSEASTLHKDERNISAEKRMAKSDGVVTSGERKMIRHQENRDSKAIYHKKHNSKRY